MGGSRYLSYILLFALLRCGCGTLVLWYEFNETSGVTIRDYSGNNFYGTTFNNPTLNGAQIEFTAASSQYVQVPTAFGTTFRTLTSYTTSFWVRFKTTTQLAKFYSFGADTNNFITYSTRGSNDFVAYGHRVSGTTQSVFTSFIASTNVWYNFVASYDGTTNTVNLYNDGSLMVSSTSFSFKPSSFASFSTCYIARSLTSTDPYLDALMVDLRIYNRALSASDVYTLFITTQAPTRAPTCLPTTTPTQPPTQLPTQIPTQIPTVLPTQRPTRLPSVAPSASPTQAPTQLPTLFPTRAPSTAPTQPPTMLPTRGPSGSPTRVPTALPTVMPTQTPTRGPTTLPPTLTPTVGPTQSPTTAPSLSPSLQPTRWPTTAPTVTPTQVPTKTPTRLPTLVPTQRPTIAPSVGPSPQPTRLPSALPTTTPTLLPTRLPTRPPSLAPSRLPSTVPSASPSTRPTQQPIGLPTKVPTLYPTGLPTIRPTVLPTSPTTARPTAAPTATSGLWERLSKRTERVRGSCAYRSGPLLWPLCTTLALILVITCLPCTDKEKKHRVRPDLDGEADGGPDAESIAVRKTNLAFGQKVFWGGHTNLADPAINIPNPLHPTRSNVYRRDLWYHLGNHHLLLSMAYADSLDLYGGVWGHRIMFWCVSMLLFGLAVALQTNAVATLAIRAGALVLITVVVMVVYPILAFHLYLGWLRLDLLQRDPSRRLLANITLLLGGTGAWGVAYSVAFARSQCAYTPAVEICGLWLSSMITLSLLQLLRHLLHFLPPSLSLRVELFGMTILRVGEWRRQLLIATFHPHTRLQAGSLRDAIRDFTAVNHCSPLYLSEVEAFEAAISRTHVNIPCVLKIVTYDVPTALRPNFTQALPLISPIEIKFDSHPVEQTFEDIRAYPRLQQEDREEQETVVPTPMEAKPRKRVIDFNRVVLEDMQDDSSDEQHDIHRSRRSSKPPNLLILPSPTGQRSNRPSLRLRDRVRAEQEQQERPTSPPLLELADADARSSASSAGGGGAPSRAPRRRRTTNARAQEGQGERGRSDMSDAEDMADDVLGIFRPRSELIVLTPGGQRYRQPSPSNARPRRRVRSSSSGEDEEGEGKSRRRSHSAGRAGRHSVEPSLLGERNEGRRSPNGRKGPR